MSAILEQIIRQVLLEAETAILKLASKKQFAKAKSAGAAFAYAVKIKGTNSPFKIKALVAGVSDTSRPDPGQTDFEKQEAEKTSTFVGKGGQYANTKYIYVMSQPQADKRQIINVWIMPYPSLFNKVSGDDITTDPGKKKSDEKSKVLRNVTTTVEAAYKIGDAKLLTVKEYNNIAKLVGVSQLQIESENDIDTTSIIPKSVTYPYRWEITGDTIDVYTIPEELNNNVKDPLVYIKHRLRGWQQYSKFRFETFLSGGGAQPNFEALTPDVMRATVEEKQDLLDEIKFEDDQTQGKETPLSPESKSIRAWNKQKDKLDREFKKINDKFWPTISPLQNRLEQLKLTGPEKDLEKVQKEYDNEIASTDGQAWLKAKQAVDDHEKTRPKSEVEKAKQQTADDAKKTADNIQKQADLDAKIKAEKEDKYTDAEIIEATKSVKYSDVTKWFQQLMIDKINTQPDLVTYLKKKNVYTPFTVDGKWGTNSVNLTKVLQKALTMKKTGKIDFKLIEQIKKLEQWKIEQNESKISLKTSLNEQGTFDFDDEEETVDLTPKPEKEKPKPEITPKPKSDSKFQPGKKYKLELKSTRLYYFMNNKFVESDYKWIAPDSTPIKYVTTSKQNKNWILVEIKGKFKFWVPLDKVSKITEI